MELTIIDSDLWTLSLMNVMQTGRKCRQYGQNFIYTLQ